MEGTIYSLIPAVLMLLLVIATRKIYLSLGVGIFVGALMITDFNFAAMFIKIFDVFFAIFYTAEDGVNVGSLYLLGFLLLLGVLTASMTASGGSKAFGNWAMEHVKTRRNAQLVPAILGVMIFIDDYFNALAVGQVSRPVTDRHHVSRTKLAYIIDSTSAPITVITPISSWGAYIIGTIGAIFSANQVVDYQPLEAFVRMIPMNLYAFTSMLLVFIVAILNLNLGSMAKHEGLAEKDGQLFDSNKGGIAGDIKESVSTHHHGKMYHLIIPIVLLVAGTVLTMLWTGYLATEETITVLSLFANTNVNLSLFLGGLFAVIASLILYLPLEKPKTNAFTVISKGMESMMPAIYILILAWMIGDIIGELDTGGFLAGLVQDAAINASYLPMILFVIAGFMALATGTSWGTFGIMLPIAAQVAVGVDVSIILPAMAAVLAGSVFGDHCSPISDTSILSSTGAGSNHIDHVVTQLPYAFISAFTALVGYFVYALTESVGISLLISVVSVAAIAFILQQFNKNK
ncbi:transporter, NhaC family [Pelagirhabdus alkalitolerans]|uniref:Transporter, NhaC family n=1 Tax=Pelagirhabdus alkalitolerans TaxID=1612202 RepID=A0A1G6LRE4_9BACI|nr:Na+/H+ antiporter NhaC family protein [Pelagirhabdus alkalitolerans]SDC45832.1 transporter, NhaC family [Pelagirhabdus alkalitolerans]